MFEDGTLTLPLLAAFLFLGGWIAETRVLLRFRADWYFLPGFPLGARPVPIPALPDKQGRTHSVCWELIAPNLVRYWVDPSARTAPSGLHGVVVLTPTRAGIDLDVRWAPPWSPLLAAVWLAALGVARGEALLTVPIASCMIGGILFVYGERARRVAAELRWSFVREEAPTEDPER